MEIQRIVATNLARARGEMSRKALADKANVSYQHIYEIEEQIKKPSLKVLERVAVALNMELYELLKEQAEERPKPLKMSSALKMAMNVPDEVYELASQLDPGDDVWDDIVETLNIAIAQKEIYKG